MSAHFVFVTCRGLNTPNKTPPRFFYPKKPLQAVKREFWWAQMVTICVCGSCIVFLISKHKPSWQHHVVEV